MRRQNQDLEKTIGRLRLEQAALLEDARQGQRLQALLGFQQKYIYTTVAAQAYGSSGSDRSHVFYIDKGAHDGLKPDMAVITADGIVGKVRDVFPHTAQVLAVNDPASGAGVILETTRIRGILKGDASGRLEVVGVASDQRIKPGENVLTAGGDMIFPRGLPVGVVEKVVRDPDRDGLVDILLKPAAHLNRLDEVLVITSTEPRFPPDQQQDIAVSDTLETDVSPAIRDQVKASEIMAEKLPGLIDPNLPADQQPLHDTSNPNPATPPPQPLQPDEFSPGAAAPAGSEPSADSTPKPRPKSPPAAPAASGSRSSGPARSEFRAANDTAEEPIVMPLLGADFRRDMEIHRYPLLVYALVPLASLVLQAWLPRVTSPYDWFDLPLVVTVYFALGRRNPIQGTIMGAAMGLFEDALTHHAIGINGIAKTVVGFLAASVGVRIEVENQIIRLLLNFLLSLLSSAIYLFVSRFLLGLALEWSWLTELLRAVGNSLIALVLFPLLDRLQIRD